MDLITLLIGTALVFLTGCATSTSATYHSVVNQTQQYLENASESVSSTAKMSFGEILYNFAQSTKSFAPGVIVASIAFGLLMLLIVRKERTWRKKIVFFFIIGIPLLMFILSYGLAILVTAFNF